MGQLSPDLGDPLREDAWASLIQRLDLSPREAEIARHLTAGHGDKAIAKSTGMACATVHSHLVRMYLKLGVESRTELVGLLFKAHVASEGELPR